jgi:hypothetical protein
LSHWRDNLCVATTPIELHEVPALIGMLAEALGEAIDVNGSAPAGPTARPSPWSAIRNWLRPRLAQVTQLRWPPDASEDTKAG